MLDAIGDEIALLVKGDNSGFMNKLALAVGDNKPAEKAKAAAPKQKSQNQQSHVRQARDTAPKPQTKGPMAGMLKKLLGK